MAIELEHAFAVPVPPEQAWHVLLDVARVAPCMPGATVDSVDGEVVTGRIKVKVGPIALTYTGQATFTERDDMAHVVKMEASGKETRGAGTASATVHARLEDDNGQTRVRVHTSLNVTGRPAQFGRGVMAEVGGKLIEKFSANLAQQLGSGSGQAPGDAAAPGQDAADTAAPDARLAIPIQELNLQARSCNSLQGEGIDTVGQLVARTADELLAIRNIGERSVREIKEKLGDLGLALAEAPAGQRAASNGGRLAGAAAGGTRQDRGGGIAGLDAAGPQTPGAAGPQTPGAARPQTPGAARPQTPGAAGPQTPAAGALEEPGARGGEPADDALDLLDVAAGPILKRVLPAVGAVIVLVVLGIRWRRRQAG